MGPISTKNDPIHSNSDQIQVISAELGLNIRGAQTPAPYVQRPSLDGQLNTGTFEIFSRTIHSKFQHLDWGAGTSMRRWAAAERRMEIKVSENGGGSGAAWMAD